MIIKTVLSVAALAAVFTSVGCASDHHRHYDRSDSWRYRHQREGRVYVQPYGRPPNVYYGRGEYRPY